MKSYERILAGYIVAKGYAASKDGDWYYGHIATDHREIKDHMRTCGIRAYDALEEEYRWQSFAGTFAGQADQHVGMLVTITCNCGAVADQPFVYQSNPGEAIRTFVRYMEENDL